MLGVVLWSDNHDQNAVIWCEDHGDLAFYRRASDGMAPELDAGDLVQFELTLHQHRRMAHNPRLIAEGLYSRLADHLHWATPDAHVWESPASSGRRRRCKRADIVSITDRVGGVSRP